MQQNKNNKIPFIFTELRVCDREKPHWCGLYSARDTFLCSLLLGERLSQFSKTTRMWYDSCSPLDTVKIAWKMTFRLRLKNISNKMA